MSKVATVSVLDDELGKVDEVKVEYSKLSNGNYAPVVSGDFSPPSVSGSVSFGEYSAPTTAAKSTDTPIPAGLKAIVIDFHSASPAPNSTELYIQFNTGVATDVTVSGSRRVIALGDSRVFQFPESTAPTSFAFMTDAGETVLGDVKATWEAVSYG